MPFDLTLLGTEDDDLLDDGPNTGNLSVLIRALGGNDTIYSIGTLNRVEAGSGNDTIYITGGSLDDGDGNDTITAEVLASLDVFNAAGDDYFSTARGHDAAADVIIHDGAGSDFFFIQSAGHEVYMIADSDDAAGNDEYGAYGCSRAVISYASTTLGVTIDLNGSAFGDEIGDDRIGGFTTAIAGSGSDTLQASEDACTLVGHQGDDELTGMSGNDTLRGGAGNDLIYDYGGKVDIRSGSGDNNIIISATGGHIVLGDGSNVLSIDDSTVTPSGTFTIELNSLDNFIVGTDADETLRITGEGLATVDLGENGTIISQNNFVTFQGSLTSTNETLVLKTLANFDVDLESQQYSGIDRVITGFGAQWLFGSATTYNSFESGSGDDHIFTHADVTDVDAGTGNDEIGCYGTLTNVKAGAGDDLVLGGTGTSLIDLGNGLNRVFGGEGAETVNFDTDTSDTAGRAFDYVFNFTQGTDKIRLEADADILAFLATGYEIVISGIAGVSFDTVSGDSLFIKDVTLAQLSTDDFLV